MCVFLSLQGSFELQSRPVDITGEDVSVDLSLLSSGLWLLLALVWVHWKRVGGASSFHSFWLLVGGLG